MGGGQDAVYRELMSIRRPHVLLAPHRTRIGAARELLALISCVVRQTRIGRSFKLTSRAPGRKRKTDSPRPRTNG